MGLIHILMEVHGWRTVMRDEERARKLCAYEGPLFGIVHMTVEQRLAREDLLLAAFTAIREEARPFVEAVAEEGIFDTSFQEQARAWLRTAQLTKAQEGA
jgi:hypothetical protein